MTIFVAIISAVILIFFGLQVFVIIRARRSRGSPAPPLPGSIGEAVGRRSRVMAYFFSPSCGGCRNQTPVVQRLGARHANIFSTNASTSPETARAFGIMVTPSVVIVENGIIEQTL
jgi:thioredoxin